MLHRSDMIKILGEKGEHLVKDFFLSQGCEVIMSDDPFDREKDMLVDGKKVEVKTEVPYYKEWAVTINSKHKNQIKKCLLVDRLIFVVLPTYSMKKEITLMEAPKPNHRFYFNRTFGNRHMHCFPLDDARFLHKITDQSIVNDMLKYNPSKVT